MLVVVDRRVKDVNELVQTVFSGPSPLVVKDVADVPVDGRRVVIHVRVRRLVSRPWSRS